MKEFYSSVIRLSKIQRFLAWVGVVCGSISLASAIIVLYLGYDVSYINIINLFLIPLGLVMVRVANRDIVEYQAELDKLENK